MNPLRSTSRMSRTRLLAGGGACLLALSVTAAAVYATGARAQTALSDNWYESAPYYSTLDSSGPNLAQVMSATGQKAFDMAFILADNG
jgi:chitinase